MHEEKSLAIDIRSVSASRRNDKQGTNPTDAPMKFKGLGSWSRPFGMKIFPSHWVWKKGICWILAGERGGMEYIAYKDIGGTMLTEREG